MTRRGHRRERANITNVAGSTSSPDVREPARPRARMAGDRDRAGAEDGPARSGPDQPQAMRPALRRWIIVGIVAAAVGLRVLALLSWRGQPPPPDTRFFLEQARALITQPDTDENGEPVSNPVAEWFHRHREPPLFSGAVGLSVRATELLAPYDPEADGYDEKTQVNDLVRTHRLMEAAYWLALVAGVWMLRPAWLILRRFGPAREWAALAGLAFVAVVPVAVTCSARPLSDTVYAVLFLYAVAVLLKGLIEREFDSLISSGLLAGLAFLTGGEALLLAPVAGLLLLLGAIRGTLNWRFALGGAGAFAAAMLALAGPYVWTISRDRDEGRFTIGRNSGNGLVHGLVAPAEKDAPPDPGGGEADASSGSLRQAAVRWPGSFLGNIYDASSCRLGYVGMFFVIAGIFFYGRELFHWGPWQLAALIYLLLVAQISILPSNGRILLSPLLLLAPLMGLGAVGLAEEITRWNPAGLAEPRRAFAWLVAGCAAVVIIATLVVVLHGGAAEI